MTFYRKFPNKLDIAICGISTYTFKIYVYSVNAILDSIQNLSEELKPVFEHLYKTGEYPSGKYKDDLEFIKNNMPQTTMLAVLLMYDGLLKNGLAVDNLVFE